MITPFIKEINKEQQYILIEFKDNNNNNLYESKLPLDCMNEEDCLAEGEEIYIFIEAI